MNRSINIIVVITFLMICRVVSLSAYDWQAFIPSESHQEGLQDSTTYYGPFSKIGYHVKNLTVYGPLSLIDSVVEGSLTVYGHCVLENSTVKGPLTLYGVINVSDSFLSDIQAATPAIRLMNTTANHIIVLKNSDRPNEQQHVFLDGTTEITGTITFEREDGIVCVAPTAIFSGVVNGGQVVNE
jgi:hypothetical protein